VGGGASRDVQPGALTPRATTASACTAQCRTKVHEEILKHVHDKGQASGPKRTKSAACCTNRAS